MDNNLTRLQNYCYYQLVSFVIRKHRSVLIDNLVLCTVMFVASPIHYHSRSGWPWLLLVLTAGVAVSNVLQGPFCNRKTIKHPSPSSVDVRINSRKAV